MARRDEQLAGPTAAPVTEEGPAGPPSTPGARTDRGPNRGRRVVVSLAVAVLLAAGLGYVLSSRGGGSSPSRPEVSGVASAAGIGYGGSSLLSLNVFPKRLSPQSPGFQLVDQHGQPVSMSQFRGKVVVWSLNDDQCTNMCALYAQDIVAADRDLGRAARHVVFLAVNANPFFPTPSALQAWSLKNDLASLPNWVYVTGTPAQLQATWSAYHVTVVQTAKTRTVTHDAIMYFVDPSGRERALANFTNGAISTAYYAHTMAQMADDLLPPGQRVHVGGPTVSAPTTGGATIGSRAPAFRLRTMGSGREVSSASLEGKPLVLNFWSSTCTICDQEMPTLQSVASMFGGKVRVVGVDVADPRSAAAAFAAKVGAHYQLLADTQGAAAAAYKVSSLPVTFIVTQHGGILARHPGALTATELAFILEGDFPTLPHVTP